MFLSFCSSHFLLFPSFSISDPSLSFVVILALWHPLQANITPPPMTLFPIILRKDFGMSQFAPVSSVLPLTVHCRQTRSSVGKAPPTPASVPDPAASIPDPPASASSSTSGSAPDAGHPPNGVPPASSSPAPSTSRTRDKGPGPDPVGGGSVPQSGGSVSEAPNAASDPQPSRSLEPAIEITTAPRSPFGAERSDVGNAPAPGKTPTTPKGKGRAFQAGGRDTPTSSPRNGANIGMTPPSRRFGRSINKVALQQATTVLTPCVSSLF